jgi:chorismate mutase
MNQTRLRAVRGATTLERDTADEVITKTQELMRELLARNAIARDDIVSVLFTATDDIHAEFPAAAARRMGLDGVPLLGARELDVPDSPLALRRCIRVMVHYYGARPGEPVYLHEAAGLLERLRREGAAAQDGP